MLIFHTFYHVIVPILIPIGIGALLHKKFSFDLKGFSKLILYYYVPALAFVKVYEVQLSAGLIFSVFGFLIIQFLIMALISYGISKLFKYSKSLSASFSNSVCLTNNGNVGIPVNAMTFSNDSLAMAIQIMVVVFELLVTFTFGIVNASKAAATLKNSLLQFVKMPILYALLAGCLFNTLHFELPKPLLSPIVNISDGMLSFALVSIGAQIASSKLLTNSLTVLLSSFTRLIVSPVCAFLIIHLMGLQGITAQVLFIASAIPTSRNSAALALEYDNEPGFAGQAVLMSMLLCSITLSVVINLSQILF